MKDDRLCQARGIVNIRASRSDHDSHHNSFFHEPGKGSELQYWCERRPDSPPRIFGEHIGRADFSPLRHRANSGSIQTAEGRSRTPARHPSAPLPIHARILPFDASQIDWRSAGLARNARAR
jgi:hypothetical protein